MKKNKTLDKLKAKRAKYAAGGYGYTDGSRTKADSQPSGGPKNKATLIGLDGKEYSTNAALEEANKRFRARVEAAESPIETYQLGDADAPVIADLKKPKMTADDLTQVTAEQTDPNATGSITTADEIEKLSNATKAVGYGVSSYGKSTKEGTVSEGATTGSGYAKKYTAEKADALTDTIAADGDVSEVGYGYAARTTKAVETERDDVKEGEAKGTAAKRDPTLIGKEYAKGATSDDGPITVDQSNIPDPTGKGRDAQTMSEREQKDLLDIITKEGVVLEDIPEFALALAREAQVGEAQTKIANELGNIPPLDLEGRKALLGTEPVGTAAEIGGIPTMAAATMQAVKGEERKVGVADMMSVVANVQPEITAAIAENPAEVKLALDEGADPKTIAAVAALPVEALVSTQMENLLAGMESGKTPLWAKPAVDAMNQQMAARGLSVSTVGRDALFNAIIQSALPMAQSNAQALQQRAQQNLSNEQQANLSTAQGVMQIRMQNLANRQTVASQSAQMSQQIKVQQGTFNQQAVMTSADQRQQTELTNAQMAQQQAQQESAQRQQSIISELDVNSRMDLANLQAESLRAGKDMDAAQQAKLSTYNAKIAKTMRQADLQQDMEKVNLSAELQVELANLTERNAADRESMTAENQERLSVFSTLIDFKKTNVSLAQQMDLANLNNEQQMELANLSERAATDGANMTETNRMKLQELTIYTSMMAKNEDLRQGAEMAQLSASEKVQLANLTFENQADSESLSAENMVELQKYEKKMQAGQVNAQLAQAMGLANLSNKQSAAMFNAQINGNLDMKQFDANQQMELANSTFMQTMTATKFSSDQQTAIQNATMLTQVDLANADARTKVSVENARNFLSMDMANLNNEQQGKVLDQQLAQQRLLSDQAAKNAALQFGATSQNQVDQFMIGQANAMEQYNATANNAMSQFNASEKNRMTAMNAGNELQASTISAQLKADISKFNSTIDNQRDTWNVANAQAVEQSNVQWRRSANTANTAAQNAANQINVQNAYNLTALDQTQIWQQLRDEATYVRSAYENDEQRQASLWATALGNESLTEGTKFTAITAGAINGLTGGGTVYTGIRTQGGGGGSDPSNTGGSNNSSNNNTKDEK